MGYISLIVALIIITSLCFLLGFGLIIIKMFYLYQIKPEDTEYEIKEKKQKKVELLKKYNVFFEGLKEY